MNQTDELISNQRRSITSLTKRLTAAMAEIKRLTALWEDAERRASLTNQEVRASYDNVVVESWKNALAEANAEIERLKARNEFLEKVAEQAVERANLRAATADDNGYCELNQSLPVWAHRHPELLGHLKEKENGTEKH